MFAGTSINGVADRVGFVSPGFSGIAAGVVLQFLAMCPGFLHRKQVKVSVVTYIQ